MSSDSWRLILIDLLFLVLAGSLGFWFRAWFRGACDGLERRLEVLEYQQDELNRLCASLQSTCATLGTTMRNDSRTSRPRSKRRSPFTTGEGTYQRAQEMIAKGVSAVEIARKLEIGLAEVEVIDRMMKQHAGKSLLSAAGGDSRFNNLR